MTREASFMRQLTLASSLCLLLALGAVGCSDDDPAVFNTTLDAASQVPPGSSPATGTTTFDFDGDSSVAFSVDLRSITAVTAVHVHSGASGATGPQRVELFAGPATGPTEGQLTQGTFGPGDVEGISLDDLLDEMRNGNAYVDVHTVANPDGEIRGQIREMQ
jgi:hypothetical protein